VAADGTFRLEHAQWTLEVESGSGGFAGIARDLEASRQSLADLLRAHGAADEEAARRLHAACDNARRAVIDSERNLADELGGKTYEELDAGMAPDGDAASVRPLAELTGLLAGADARLNGLDRELAAKAGRIDELKRAFGDQDKLFEKVVDITARRKALDAKRAALPPLPAGVSDPAAFAAEYQQKAAGLDSQRREKNQLEVDRAGIHMPADSAEELKAQCRDLEEAFNATLRKAHAIARIRQAVAEAEQAAPGANPYAGLKATLEGYIARMTDKRYEAIQMAESLPSGFVRKDGKVVGADLLSTGTRDVLGLAIRLAMAGCLLGGREGFLVMDDPLVDMDPRRQAAAADLLSEYARERQLIVFTCHPAHSEKLGGAGVEI
jgi:exonuclease SbcC